MSKLINTTYWPKTSGFGVFGELDKVFDSFFSDSYLDRFLNVKVDYPMDYSLSETDKEFYIDIPLAGHKKDDIVVTVQDGYLNVEVNGTTKRDDVKYFKQSISHKSRKWKWDIIDKGEENGLSSKFEDGMLKITIPKTQKVEPVIKKIEVQ